MIEFINNPSERELNSLVYCKYLFNQATRFLENTSNSAFFNISILLFSNAIELAIKTLDECLNIESNSRNKTHITVIAKDIQKKGISLPYNDIFQIFDLRNGVYHSGSLLVYETCKSFKDKSNKILSSITEILFKETTFDNLSLTNLIHNEMIRNLTIEAEKYLNIGDFTNCNYKATEAFARFEQRLKERSHTNTGSLLSNVRNSQIDWSHKERSSLNKKRSNSDLLSFSTEIEKAVNKKFENFFGDLDILITMRNYYEDYKHFKSMTPIYHLMLDGSVIIDKVNKRNLEFSKNDCEFMINFIINLVLELEPQLKPISVRYFNGKIHKIIE